MVAVFGDITAQDDFTHALGPESNFNESMYCVNELASDSQRGSQTVWVVVRGVLPGENKLPAHRCL